MSSRQLLEHRENTKIITLNELVQEFSEPERLRLQLTVKVKKKPLDIGSFAYLIRGKNKSVHDDRGTPLVIESFVESRRELIVRVLESFVGLRDKSVLANFFHTEYFIDWLNAEGYREIFFSSVDAQKAYRDYTAHLNQKISDKKLKPRTASSYQTRASSLIKLLYPDNSVHILAGAVRIVPDRGSATAGAAHVELYRDVCFAIAQQCSDFILNKKPYPLVVGVRDYEVVIFPSNRGASSPFKDAAPSYNSAERRIATAEEYFAAFERVGRKKPRNYNVARELRSSQASLDAANEDGRNWHRLNLASLAAKAYAILFFMITGATPAEFEQFSYEDALKVEKSPLKKELSAVKFRAGGKSTLYNIGRGSGLSLLKEYLKLRAWILDGARHERLFFAMPTSGQLRTCKSFGDLNVTSSLEKFYEFISGVFLDPTVPRLSTRKIRKHKSTEMHSARLSPSTVAASLNHTEAVNLSTYAEATPEQQQSEFSLFWDAIRHAAHVVRERSRKAVASSVAIAAGHCEDFNKPTSATDVGLIIEPNCRTQYGCLYCENYLCHGDEEDLHKILSLQYVVNAVRKSAPDAAHTEALFKELSIRIEFIVDALSERSSSVKQTVEKVKAKVFEYGELTKFWEVRLGRYEKMGIVF
ncbi:hypothetical protein [Pseudomonas aeruginosa]|uniref:hypothetical protein n=1 Tax=Pseudomonas aeruginosa TaxID=287 RepID=UPI0009AA1B5A|nr:hypothetical protein [Pseudomonas aeruginosa]OPE35830.1 hypothetical protein APB40_33165 [Pseudomonas aeruginosa]WGV68191.1 hypothetical protein QIU11_05320 [Pseudomonas aeruginosa]